MADEYLATGFARVDDRDNPDAYRDCLALLDGLPYFRAYKEHSYERLGLRPGLSLLDLGCGLGDDAVRMSAHLVPNGRVVGVDASAHLIARAVERAPAGSGVRFVRADGRSLPFADGSFARCRVDRTLQHIREPRRALAELIRVLEPGGRLLAYDNDWGSFALSGSDERTTELVIETWVESFTNPRIGRYLKRDFVEAGLHRVSVEPSVSVLNELDLADRVYNLRQTLDRLRRSGRIDDDAAAAWLAELRAQTETGGFLCALTTYLVVGEKPK